MKILVPIKRVTDPDHANAVKVNAAGTDLVAEGLQWKMNPYDEYALEAALRLNENGQTRDKLGETVVVTIGPKQAASVLREKALAMGADRGLLVVHPTDTLDTMLVALALAKIVEREKPDLVLMGKLAVDVEENACGQMLAEVLGWPMATQVQRIVTTNGGQTLTVGREVDTGEVVLELDAPAVITCADRILAPTSVSNGVTPAGFAYPESDGARYPSLKGIMSAKKKPLEELELASLNIVHTPAVSYTAYEAAKGRSGSTVFVSSAAELLDKLRQEAKVL